MVAAYQPKYTSIDTISRKLRARLRINNTDLPDQYARMNLAKTPVDEELIREVIEEAEEYLDQYLCVIYRVPLQNAHPILRRCIDALVIADLMEYHFNITAYSESTDPSGFGVRNRNEAYQIIRSLTFGYNIPIPTVGAEVVQRVPVQPFRLKGEVFLPHRQDQYFPTDQYTLVNGLRKNKNFADIKFDPDCAGDRWQERQGCSEDRVEKDIFCDDKPCC